MLDLESAQLFIDVADLGSLSLAAEKNYVSKSMVKKRMDALESYIGTPLLQRGPRGTEPTAAGRVFLDRIQALFRYIDDMRGECLAAADSASSRTVRVAHYSDFVFPMVQYCCDHYAQLYLSDTIQPVFMPFADAYKGVREGLVDLAICARPGANESAGLASSTLYATRMGAFVAVGNPLAQAGVLTRSDLAAHEVVMHTMWCPREEVLAWAAEPPTPFTVRLTTGGTEVMQEVCARGGIYLYPETDAGQFPYAFVALEQPISSYSALVYPTSPNRATLDFVNATLDYLAPYTNRSDLRMLVDWRTRPN